MTKADRLRSLEYTFYMVIEQELSLNGKGCETISSPYLKKLSLAWSETPGSFVDLDFDKCEQLYTEEIEPLLSEPFFEGVKIMITPKKDTQTAQSDITIRANKCECILNVSFNKDESISCKKTIINY